MRFPALLATSLCVALGCGGPSSSSSAGNLCDGVATDVATDVDHCGRCEIVCPEQPHAGRTCSSGSCGRSPCEPGWIDLDPSVPGCEAENVDGLPETGVVFSAVASAATPEPGSESGQHRIQGTLAEPTPATAEGAVETRSERHRNVMGFNAIRH